MLAIFVGGPAHGDIRELDSASPAHTVAFLSSYNPSRELEFYTTTYTRVCSDRVQHVYWMAPDEDGHGELGAIYVNSNHARLMCAGEREDHASLSLADCMVCKAGIRERAIRDNPVGNGVVDVTVMGCRWEREESFVRMDSPWVLFEAFKHFREVESLGYPSIVSRAVRQEANSERWDNTSVEDFNTDNSNLTPEMLRFLSESSQLNPHGEAMLETLRDNDREHLWNRSYNGFISRNASNHLQSEVCSDLLWTKVGLINKMGFPNIRKKEES